MCVHVTKRKKTEKGSLLNENVQFNTAGRLGRDSETGRDI